MTPEEFIEWMDDGFWNQKLVSDEAAFFVNNLSGSPMLEFVQHTDGAEVIGVWPTRHSWESEIRTSVKLLLNPETDRLNLQSGCSCGSPHYTSVPSYRHHHACYHVPAVILKLRKFDPDAFGIERDVEAWDHYLQQYSSKPPSAGLMALPEPGHHSGEFVVLLNHGQNQRFPELTAHPMSLRRTKKGTVDLRQSVHIELRPNGLGPIPQSGWNAEIEAVLTTLLTTALVTRQNEMSSYDYRHHMPQVGIRVATAKMLDAMQILLRSATLHYQSLGQGVVLGADLDVRYEWEKDGQGVQSLHVLAGDHRLQGPRLQTLQMGGRALLLDIDNSKLHFLNSRPDELQAAFAMPALRPQIADKMRYRLAALPLKLPLPTAIDPAIEVRVPPKGTLSLSAVGASYARGRLSFTYDGFQGSASANGYTEATRDGKRHLVFRDADGEQAAVDALKRKLGAITHKSGSTFDVQIPSPPGAGTTANTLGTVISALEEIGLDYELPQGTRFNALAEPADFSGHINDSADGIGWLEVGLGFALEDGRRIDLLPILRDLLQTNQLTVKPDPNENPDSVLWISVGDGDYVPIPVARLRSAVQPILDWLRMGAVNDKGLLRIRAAAFGSIEALGRTAHADFTASKKAQNLLDRIRNRRTDCPVPKSFKGTLREYQHDGLRWMAALADCGMGGVLADDMGLGKTVQVIAHILAERARRALKKPVIVVVPLTTLPQWIDRLAEFAPDLRVLKLHGPNRGCLHDRIPEFHVVVTTYKLLYLDQEQLLKHRFSILVMDETKNIKSAKTYVAQATRVLKADRRIAMGGSVIENNITEFWACMDAVEPGILGTYKSFMDHLGRAVERGDADARLRLVQRTGPIMLRRRKEEVLKDLPPKVVTVVHCEMDSKQRDVYETLRTMISSEIMQLLAEKGLTAAQMMVITKLLRLRQCCDSPGLIDLEVAKKAASCKELWIEENVPTLVANGRRILIFSEWTSMLDRIAKLLDRLKIGHSLISGEVTSKGRELAASEFKSGSVNVFLISVKSGGIGLDVPEADTVIMCEPQWNPSDERQAVDRAHRFGQKNSVNVYNLIVPGTVEEGIIQLQHRKLALASSILDNETTASHKLTEDDIRALLAPMSDSANGGEVLDEASAA